MAGFSDFLQFGFDSEDDMRDYCDEYGDTPDDLEMASAVKMQEDIEFHSGMDLPDDDEDVRFEL